MIHKHRIAGIDWYWISRVYLNERVASAVFERQMRYARKHKGRLDAGVYRHGRSDGPMVYITAVSLHSEGLAELAPMLLGKDVEQDIRNVEALIVRRARVLSDLEKQKAGAGSYRIHHEGPTRMDRLGEMEDDS